MKRSELSGIPHLAVITGAVTGIGAALAELLVSQGWNLVLLNRSRQRTTPLLDQLRAIDRDAQIQVIETDLSDHVSLHASALQITDQYESVDALFNNAGVLRDDLVVSDMGNEMHFEINTIAPYLLTHALRSALKSAAELRGHSVVVTPSTSAVKSVKQFDIDTLRKGTKGGLLGAYAQSKLAWAVLNAHLAESFHEDGIELFAVDPGVNRTGMTASVGAPLPVRLLWRLLPKPVAGAKRQVEVLSKEWRNRSGSLVIGGKVKSIPADMMTDQNVSKLLAIVNEAITSNRAD
ncbi:MAG: SDR family NAD(P)-dependent oxidoreductase [Planctomycetota bacterium]